MPRLKISKNTGRYKNFGAIIFTPIDLDIRIEVDDLEEQKP